MKAIDARILDVLSRTTMQPAEALERDKALASLGIGSLEQIECVLALEDELRVELRDADLWKLRTVGDVFDAVHRALQQSERSDKTEIVDRRERSGADGAASAERSEPGGVQGSPPFKK